MNKKAKSFMALFVAVAMVTSPISSTVGFTGTTISSQELLTEFLKKLSGSSAADKRQNLASLGLLHLWAKESSTKANIKNQIEANYPAFPGLADKGFTKGLANTIFDMAIAKEATLVDVLLNPSKLADAREDLTQTARAIYAISPAAYKDAFDSIRKPKAEIKEAVKQAIATAMDQNDLLAIKVIQSRGVGNSTYEVKFTPGFEALLSANLNELVRDDIARADERYSTFMNTTFDLYKLLSMSFLNELVNNKVEARAVTELVESMKIGSVTYENLKNTVKPTIKIKDEFVGRFTTPLALSTDSFNGASFKKYLIDNYVPFLLATDDIAAETPEIAVRFDENQVNRAGNFEVEFVAIDKDGNESAVNVKYNIAVTRPARQPAEPAEPQPQPQPQPQAPVILPPNETPLSPAGTPKTPATGTETIDDEDTAKGAAKIQITPAEALAKMQSLGIIGKNFNSKAQLNFTDISATFAKLLGLKFDPKSKDAKVAKTAEQALKNAGLMKGITLAKGGKITRDQMATLMANVYAMKDKTVVNKALKFDETLKTPALVKAEFYDALKKLYKKDTLMTNANVTGLDYLIIFFTMFLD